MARWQQQSIVSIPVLVAFVVLWLASTGLLLVLYTRQSGLVEENERLTQANRRLISSSEQNSVTLFQEARPEGPTVVGLLEGARGDLAELASGDPSNDVATVRSKLDDWLQNARNERLVPNASRYKDISCLDALSMVYEAFGSQHAQLGAANDRVTELEAEVDRLVEANTQMKSDFDQRATGIADQLARAEAERAEQLRERDETLARLEREFEERRRQGDADVTSARQQATALQGQLAQLRERFTAYQAKFGELLIRPEELATARQPDGRVLKAIPGDDVVYIDLGKRDAVPLGLKFAVYSAEKGIPSSGQGKAQIEVVSVSDESAACRIRHVSGHQVIVDGDLIANPVYDRDRPLSFLVVGRFDLNHDGMADREGAGAIEAMISEWGGTLSPDLTALTDFVVLGGSPPRPRSDTEATPEQAERLRAISREYDQYVETAESAKSLSVPIMTQEVFLSFLGYSRM